jgi:hypothetical protein
VRAQAAVDPKCQSLFKDDDDKNVHFAKFMLVNSITAKDAMRQTPSSVPAVRGLSYSRDPSKVLDII